MRWKGGKNIIILCVLIGCLVAGFELYAWARTDLDWMMVANHFDMWNAQKDTWEFSPHRTMNWWDAYQLTMYRLVVSVSMFAVGVCTVVYCLGCQVHMVANGDGRWYCPVCKHYVQLIEGKVKLDG